MKPTQPLYTVIVTWDCPAYSGHENCMILAPKGAGHGSFEMRRIVKLETEYRAHRPSAVCARCTVTMKRDSEAIRVIVFERGAQSGVLQPIRNRRGEQKCSHD